MTRLFVRIYVSVLIILFIALCLMAFAFQYRFDLDFDTAANQMMHGAVRLARDSLDASPAESAPVMLEKLQKQIKEPLQLLSEDQIPMTVREWLSKDDDVIVYVNGELSVLTPLKNGTDTLRFGPITVGDGTIEMDVVITIGVLLLLVAIAIATLLRPLARQLSVMEQTAVAIADGHLAARVDEQKTDAAKTLARAFNNMATRTEALLRTQRELLQAVSHELRTPLSRINFAIDLIRTAHDDNERELRLRSLDTASQELDELVGELLQYVRLETSLPQPVREEIELLPLVEELIEKISLVSNGIQFEVGPTLKNGNVHMIADQSGVIRVIGNLLANARRFSRQEIIVEASISQDGITIDVDDDGPGIPEADRERVFDPFVRLNETDHGTGLGLSLVKRILTNHRGTVIALQSPLGGCRIRTFWPASTDGRE